ncbi:MAG TPA: beta-propeller fold lactonase family protein, partial [Candidatus Angelobacter sp.]|nr:beta-propeller fold lactonase family protein [Candidatus Angelobacter sp.]
TVDPAGRFLYAHTEGADFNINISQFQINQTTGALTFIRDLSLGEEDANNFVWSPGGAFLYQGAGTPKVKVFAKSSISGALQQIQEVGCNCANGPDGAGNVAIDGQGKFLFQATVSESGVAVYSRNSTTGLLTPLGSAFLSVSGSTPALAADATGRFLEVVDDTGTTTFAVGADGTLTRAAGPTATPASGLVVLAVRF